MTEISTRLSETVEELHLRFEEGRSPDDRARLIDHYRPLALTVARRTGKSARERDDVNQVALIGLMNAVDRYSSERGVQFSTYAWRLIEGEIKRYFRDSTRPIHVPRSLQEQSLAISGVAQDLTHELKRAPTFTEISARSGLSVEQVIEATEMQRTTLTSSLDLPDDDQGSPIQLGSVDRGFMVVDQQVELHRLLLHLPDREREVIRLRFVEQLSQSVIAEQLGISQMHVSRLLARSLNTMRVMAKSSE